MITLTQEEKNKILAGIEILEKGDLAVLKKLLDFQDFVDENKGTIEKIVKQAEDVFANIQQGKDGKNGRDGKDGRDGRDGKDGVNGKDGKDGTEIKGEEIVDKINALPIKSDLQIGKEHIKGLQDELDKLNKKQGVTVFGGVTDMRIERAFKYILKTEAPVGDIDGINTSYTVSKAIFAILSFSLNGETIAQLPNYTISGKTITFSTALPAAYSGKDFEIKYI